VDDAEAAYLQLARCARPWRECEKLYVIKCAGAWVHPDRLAEGNFGILFFPSGQRYEGMLDMDGRPDGEGTMWWPTLIHSITGSRDLDDYERYEGEWKQGLRHGRGVKYGHRGKVCSAIWQGDLIVNILSKTAAQ